MTYNRIDAGATSPFVEIANENYTRRKDQRIEEARQAADARAKQRSQLMAALCVIGSVVLAVILCLL